MAITRPKPRASKSTSKTLPSSSDAQALEVTTTSTASSTTQKTPLLPSSINPPHLFILPRNTSAATRIISLAHPKTGAPCRYLSCPDRGFFEFKRVAASRSAPKSWLLAPPSQHTDNDRDADAEARTESERASSTHSEQVRARRRASDEGAGDVTRGYVTSSAELFVATPIDPLFLLLPALATTRQGRSHSRGHDDDDESRKPLFLTLDDHIDSLSSTSPCLKPLLYMDQRAKYLSLFEHRMAAVCDSVSAGDETMYRLNDSKLFAVLLAKAERMIAHGLPASMEDKFVVKALQVPMLSLKRDESSMHELLAEEEEESGARAPRGTGQSTPRTDSQTSLFSTDTPPSSISERSTTASPVDLSSQTWLPSAETTTASQSSPPPLPLSINAPEGIPRLLRLQTAFSLICSSYLPRHISARQKAFFQACDTLDLKSLEAHLQHLANLEQQALAARSMGDFSRKRSLNEDDEAGEGRAESKRRKEEEEKKRKANMSRGVRDLKKVDVKGMKKMSDFFKKKS